MCYFASGYEHSYTYPASTCSALNVWTEEKWSFCFCRCCYLFKQQQREQCDVSNHICYASHSILPTRRASREVSGTVEQQPSLECMCHNSVYSEPWLMLCIYNHPSQCCHHNGHRTWVCSWMVWANPLLVWDWRNVQHPPGSFLWSAVPLLMLLMARESSWNPFSLVVH